MTPTEFFENIAEDITVADLQDAAGRGSWEISNEQCAKYNIKVCVLTYMVQGETDGVLMLNPAHWAALDYYISDTFYAKDDMDKEWPYKIFLGDER